MALCSLLRMGQSDIERKTFGFEHAMAHRAVLGSMSPLPRFSVLPYFIDPQQSQPRYLLNHQQAHWDMYSALPSFWPGTILPPNVPVPSPWPIGGLGITNNPILMDTPLDNAEKLGWWTFANHTDHLVAMNSLDLVDNWVYPFW